MANFGTLKQRLGRRRGFDGNDARLGDFINDAYMAICGRRQTWSWLRRTYQFRTQTPLSVTASAAASGATFTYGSRLVSNMTTVVGGSTRTGARLEAPDGTVNRIVSHDATTNCYIESPFGGTTSPALAPGATPPTYRDSWKIYWDEYPLPNGTAVIESVVMTGNGFVRHVKEMSLLPTQMKTLAIKDYESYPQYYSLERHSQIPTPETALTATASAGTGLDTGVYKYRYCYYNTHTQELGPMSAETSVTTTAANARVALVFVRRGDYGLALFRTKVGGSTFYHLGNAAAFATTTFTDAVIDSGIGFSHQDTDTAGALMSTNIGAVTERGEELSGIRHVRLWPPPDEEYMIDVTYFRTPQDLVLDADSPLVPRQFQPVILDLAESIALSEEENHGAAAQKRAYAMEAVDRMEREAEADPGTVIQVGRGGPDIAQDTGGSWPRTVTG